MKYAIVLVLALACLPLTALSAGAPPNLVILLADDLGYNDVSFDGRKEWQTPNLDKLASEGTIYRRWYTGAVVCTPSRAALMTGRYSIHTGVCGNSDQLVSEETTIAEALKAHGYATAIFGKWHLGGSKGAEQRHPLDQGFDEFFGFMSGKHAWQKFPKELWDGREMKPSHGYADTLFTDHAVDFIQRHKDKPFFIYLPYIASHGLVQAPEDEIARHKGKLPEADSSKPLNATYAAEITQLDKEIARVMQALREQDLDGNTLVIFTSDHGATFEILAQGTSWMLDSNYPFRGQKRTLWEGGMRVPAFVRWPGHVPAGKESHELMHACDVMPTFLAAAGVQADPKWKLDGANMLNVWLGKEKAPDRTLFWEWRQSGNNYLAAMRGNYKLLSAGGNHPELFDVEADPAERRTCQATEKETYTQLQKALADWLATESDLAKENIARANKSKPSAAQSKAQDHSPDDE